MRELTERNRRLKLYFCSLRSRTLSQEDSFVREEGGFIRNISENGLCVSTSARLSSNDVLSVYFRLPSIQHNFSLLARVIWVNKDEAGLSFLEIREPDKACIREYFENCGTRNMVEHYQRLQEMFTYSEADNEELRKEIYRFRYLVYVKEKGWEPANEAGLEIDEYDRGSAEFMVRDRNDVVIAATRMIPADKFELPIEKHFGVDITRGGALPRSEIVEVSRLCIAKEYRRRIEDLNYRPSADGSARLTEGRARIHPRSPNLLFGLWRQMYQYGVLSGKIYWYMVIENRLANSIMNAGIKLVNVGAPRNYHGLRYPYFNNILESESEVRRNNPMLLHWLSDGMRVSEPVLTAAGPFGREQP